MATILSSTPVTAAITGQVLGSVLDAAANNALPTSVVVQGNFVYGSGGTTAKYWLQTSLDGVNWTDVMSFAFALTSKVQFAVVTSQNGNAVASQQDGALADNTVVTAVLGRYWRVKSTTTGTYVGTTIAFNIYSRYM